MEILLSGIAIVISLISLGWQIISWKKDKKLQEQIIFHSHRLTFYTDFFDNLHKLEKYDTNSYQVSDGQIQKDLDGFCHIFHRFSQEVIALFPITIQKDVISVYNVIQDIISNPPSLSTSSVLVSRRRSYSDFRELQKRIKQLNLGNTLKNNILNYLKLEGQENE